MSAANLEGFRQLVLEDLALQEVLRETPDLKTFLALAVRLGGERGCSFNAEDLEAALRDGQRGWLERWVEV